MNILEILEDNDSLSMDSEDDRITLAEELRSRLFSAMDDFNQTIGDDGYGASVLADEFSRVNNEAIVAAEKERDEREA